MKIKTEYGATLKALENRYPEHLNIQITEDQHLGEIKVTKKCSVTNKDYSVGGHWRSFFRWLVLKEYVQDVFRVHEDQREFLISGTTPAEWSKFIGDEEE